MSTTGAAAERSLRAHGGGSESDADVLRVILLDTMLGSTGRASRSQGEQLVELLSADGHEVRSASRHTSRVLRLLDMLRLLARWGRWGDVASIAVFSGPAFWLADITSRLARRIGLPIVLVLHGGNLPSYAEAHPRRVRALLDRAAVVVAPSSYNAKQLAAYSGKPIRVISNVVDVDVDAWSARRPIEPRIFWMRALHPIYGPDVAIEVMKRVVAAFPQATMAMAGPDKANMTRELESRIDQSGLSDRIDLVGFLDREGKEREFNRHDIYLNTSRVDNTPISLLEAAAHGLVLVSTDAGGIPDLFVDDRTALLSPVDDVDSLASSIVALLGDEQRAVAMAIEARDLARSMTWEELGPQWRSVFTEARARPSR